MISHSGNISITIEGKVESKSNKAVFKLQILLKMNSLNY